MAGARVFQDEFMCSVCLDLLKDPVTIQCGHSYCKSCITGYWDQEDQMRVYSCPQCKQTCSPRPALARNTMLAEVVEKLKKTNLHYAGAGDVQCDVWTEKQVFQTRHSFHMFISAPILTAHSIHTAHSSRNEQQLQETVSLFAENAL